MDWVPWVLTGGVAAWLFSQARRIRFVGDNARAGDEVFVPVTRLNQMALPQLPPGVAVVSVLVRQEEPDTLLGDLVALVSDQGRQALPTPIPNIRVARDAVRNVARRGMVVA